MEHITKTLKPRFDIEQMYKKYKKFLKGAKEGEVKTRFPPEPSGFMHIGHAKASLLNFHYANFFKGKMLMRFDDTNPSKEKEEYVQSILADLKTLGVKYDEISATSDHFQLIQEYCTNFIKEGKAYCDATNEEEMKKERWDGIESKYRNTSVEENLKIWKEMIKGKHKEYCVRAKIDMKCLNKCMRDPVIFRHQEAPHQKTGTKYKVYPTYDFACPIVDSKEGITHAMRSKEYTDRNQLYNWFLKNLKLRKLKIIVFSRLNFKATTLSKRKLNWFVENKLVDGWNDPRFPTIQGIIRRGMLVNTLIEFMLEQGPSNNENLMEWDKIWSLNRKNLDPIALKFSAISEKGKMMLEISNLEKDEVKMVALHPKNKEAGNKPKHFTK